MALRFPILQDCGQLGFEREVTYPGLLIADFGAGYGATAGSNESVMTFRLTWNKAYDAVAMFTDEDGNQVDRKTYIWNFYRRRMENMNEPFIIEDVLDTLNRTTYNATGATGRKLYLVRFTDTKLSQRQVEQAFISGFGLQVKQYRQPGDFVDDLNNEVMAPNPQEI
jgi:hypothetical protein